MDKEMMIAIMASILITRREHESQDDYHAIKYAIEYAERIWLAVIGLD